MARQSKILTVLLLTGHALLSAQNVWEQTPGPNSGPVAALAIDPTHIFAGTIGGGVFLSTNNGGSWQPVGSTLPMTRVNTLALTPSSVLAGGDSGLFRSPDRGITWLRTNISGLQVFALTVRSAPEVYAGLLDFGVFRSVDDGMTWTPTSLGNITVRTVAVNLTNGFVFAGSAGLGVFRSTDNGAQWTPVNNGLSNPDITTLVVDNSGILFAGTVDGGVFRSLDHGALWVPVNNGLQSLNILSSTSNALGHLFAGTSGGVFRTTDGGAGWMPFNAGLTDPNIRSLALNPGGVLFAGGERGFVFRSVESTSATFTVLRPNGGEDWQIGTVQQIQWTSRDIIGGVRIELTRDNGASYETIVDNTGNTGAFPFSVSGPATTQARVRVSSHVDPALADLSDNLFTISTVIPATVTVVAPNGGENWQIGSLQNIRWTSTNVTGKVSIEVSRNGGQTFAVVTDSTDDTGTFSWTVSGPGTLQGRIRITSIVTPTAVDISDGDFVISAQPSVVVVAPNGGEVWPIGTIDTIRWTSAGVTGSARVELSRDGGFLFEAIDTGAPDVGSYAWRVTGPVSSRGRVRITIGGVSDISDNEFAISTLDVLGPDTIAAGQTPAVIVRPPATFGVTAAWLHVRSGGKVRYDSLPLAPVGNELQGVIPASYITIRGVEYYVLLSDGQVSLTFPDSLPALNPAIIRVRVGRTLSPVRMSRRTYRMVSVPLDLPDPTVGGVLGDDYGPYNRSQWRVFRWESARYVEHPGISGTFTPGNALWLITHTGAPFDVDAGLSVNTRLPYLMTIPPGWSQIANPFAFPVAWDSVGPPASLDGPFLYEGRRYRATPVAVLQPWEGYFVRNRDTRDVSIAVPAVEADSTLGLAADWPQGVSYCLKLSAATGESDSISVESIVGFKNDATAGTRRYPEPPLVSDEFLRFSIVEGSERYLASLKPLTDEGAFWDIELFSTLEEREVQVRLTETGEMPEGWEVFILDRDNAALVPVQRDGFTVSYGAGVRSFRVILGTRAFADAQSEGIPLVPLQYSLFQNYPNPFNPDTRIRYQLSKRSSVKLEIFSVLGEKIRTLVRGEQMTGTYELHWDGTNDAGHSVGSGVYLYRLRAEGAADGKGALFHATHKMILLR